MTVPFTLRTERCHAKQSTFSTSIHLSGGACVKSLESLHTGRISLTCGPRLGSDPQVIDRGWNQSGACPFSPPKRFPRPHPDTINDRARAEASATRPSFPSLPRLSLFPVLSARCSCFNRVRHGRPFPPPHPPWLPPPRALDVRHPGLLVGKKSRATISYLIHLDVADYSYFSTCLECMLVYIG